MEWQVEGEFVNKEELGSIRNNDLSEVELNITSKFGV